MNIKALLTTIMTLTALAIAPLCAEAPKSSKKSPCDTRVECDIMVDALQGKIDVLETKGLKNFRGKDRLKYSELLDKFLAVKNEQVAQAKARTAEQRKIIAKQRKITAEQREIIAEENVKQAAYKSVSKKLDKISGSLKDKSTK